MTDARYRLELGPASTPGHYRFELVDLARPEGQRVIYKGGGSFNLEFVWRMCCAYFGSKVAARVAHDEPGENAGAKDPT